MLSQFKEKLLNATKGISLFDLPNHGNSKLVHNTFYVNGGFNILSHFKKDWEYIHEYNEQNAKQSDEVSKVIEDIIHKTCEDKKRLSVISSLIESSNIKNNVSKCTKNIEMVLQNCKEIEEKLLVLEDVIENIEFEIKKREHRHHLLKYKLRKNDYLKEVEEALQEKHASKISEMELKRTKDLEERQKVFHEAFKSDLEVFKTFGTIPKRDLQQGHSALLEEIQVNFDENELNTFLDKDK